MHAHMHAHARTHARHALNAYAHTHIKRAHTNKKRRVATQHAATLAAPITLFAACTHCSVRSLQRALYHRVQSHHNSLLLLDIHAPLSLVITLLIAVVKQRGWICILSLIPFAVFVVFVNACLRFAHRWRHSWRPG